MTNHVQELRRVHRERERALTKLAAQVRRELVIPLCKRYDIRYNTSILGRLNGGSCFAFITRDGKLVESADAGRRLGLRMGRVFVILSRNVDDPTMYGGDRELGNYIKPYML